MGSKKAQILLTNDDGIRSPGLWAAAEALSAIGFVTVVAPREQYSGGGRSMPTESDGVISEQTVTVGQKCWTVYAVGGSPAQAVQHGILELMPQKPDLVVAGINYGENVGVGITISGTVGAALEAASFGAPALAISFQTGSKFHRSYSTDIDFSAAARFAELFGSILLRGEMFPDVDVLKVDVPKHATRETPWRVTHVSRASYYVPVRPERRRLSEANHIGYQEKWSVEDIEPGSDVYAVAVQGVVSVTPLSLDMTSRVDLRRLEGRLRELAQQA